MNNEYDEQYDDRDIDEIRILDQDEVKIIRRRMKILTILNIIQPILLGFDFLFYVILIIIGLIDAGSELVTYDVKAYWIIITLIVVAVNLAVAIVRFKCTKLKSNIFNIINFIAIFAVYLSEYTEVKLYLMLILFICIVYQCARIERTVSKKLPNENR